MTEKCSAGTHNACAVVDDGSILQACCDCSTGEQACNDSYTRTFG